MIGVFVYRHWERRSVRMIFYGDKQKTMLDEEQAVPDELDIEESEAEEEPAEEDAHPMKNDAVGVNPTESILSHPINL